MEPWSSRQSTRNTSPQPSHLLPASEDWSLRQQWTLDQPWYSEELALGQGRTVQQLTWFFQAWTYSQCQYRGLFLGLPLMPLAAALLRQEYERAGSFLSWILRKPQWSTLTQSPLVGAYRMCGYQYWSSWWPSFFQRFASRFGNLGLQSFMLSHTACQPWPQWYLWCWACPSWCWWKLNWNVAYHMRIDKTVARPAYLSF
jgi:hypothetical protein